VPEVSLGTIAIPKIDSSAADLANPFVQRAVTYYEQGKTDAALAEYRKGLVNDPMDSDTWFGLAELLHELGRTKQAIDTYTLALTTIEHAPELRLPFAELLLESKKKADAIKVLQKGIELDPDASTEMKSMLGKILVGELDETNVLAASAAAAEPAAATATPGAKSATPAKPGVTAARPTASKQLSTKKRKKLCKLFCPGTFQPIGPKPN
jgi:tetratricopeptide (TPR) repeat protein